MSNDVRINIITKLIDKGLGDLDGKLKKASGILENIGKAGLGAGVAAGGALASATVSAVNFADEVNAAVNSISKQTGASGEQLEEYKKIATNLYAGPPPVSDSIMEVADALAQTENITELTGDALKGATKDASNLANAFDKDINEVLRAADSLVRNKVAGSFDEAFDLIAKGFTEGADRGDDFLDTLNEYSQDFGQLGFTADETLNLINNGLNKGVLNTDKIGDALNEAFINLKDPARLKALNDLGVSFDDLASGFADGSIKGSDALDKIIQRLEDIEDPLLRDEAGVALFGSIWEDTGENVVLALNDIDEAMGTTSGAMDELADKPQTLEQLWTSAWRNIQVAAEPLGQEVIPLISDALLDFIALIQTDEFKEMAKQFGTDLKEGVEKATEAFGKIAEAFGIVDEEASNAEKAIGLLIGVVNGATSVIDFFADGAEQAAALADQVSTIVDLLESSDSDLLGGVTANPRDLHPFSLAANAAGSLLGFAEGGIVPGPRGAPIPAIVHGGEEVIPVGGNRSSNGITININAPVFGVDDLDRKIDEAGQALVNQIALQTS